MHAGLSSGCAGSKERNIEQVTVYKVGARSWDMMGGGGGQCEISRNSRSMKKSQVGRGVLCPGRTEGLFPWLLGFPWRKDVASL